MIIICIIIGIIAYFASELFNAAMLALGHFLWDMGIGRP